MLVIEIEVLIKNSLDKVWEYWTGQPFISQWYSASDDWWTPWVNQNFQVDQGFVYRMEARDGSMGFDFSGVFTEIVDHEKIVYVLEDGRKVLTTFEERDGRILLKQAFDAEDQNSAQMQKDGWQAILNHFKSFCEGDQIEMSFRTVLGTNPNRVWEYLTLPRLYEEWAIAFSEQPKFVGQWVEGGTIDFIDFQEGGTRVQLDKVKPFEKLYMTHIAMIDGQAGIVEDHPEAPTWVGTKENYDLELVGKETILTIHIMCHPKYVDYLRNSWEKAVKLMTHVIK